MFIETRCRLVDGVDHDEAVGEGLRGGHHASKGFGEQHAAETPALEPAVEREPGK